jgi:hypothetical protein
MHRHAREEKTMLLDPPIHLLVRPQAAQQRLRAREEYVATRAVEGKRVAPLKVNHTTELHMRRRPSLVKPTLSPEYS